MSDDLIQEMRKLGTRFKGDEEHCCQCNCAKELLSFVRKLVGEWTQKSEDFVDRWEGYSDDGDLRSARSIQDCATELEKLLAAHLETK